MTQQFSYNLVDSPWLPCVDLNGQATSLSLRDTLMYAHSLRSLAAGSPLESVALHRLLLAVLHRVFGPVDYDEWTALWRAQEWDVSKLETYLDEWGPRFDLFDSEHPFFQAPDPRVKLKSTISLQHDRASGNNPTLFDHHTEKEGEQLSPAQAARALVAAQAFGLAGLSGIAQKFTDGTCAGGILFMVEGDTLKETLLLNMPPYPDEQVFASSPADCPAWEMEDAYSPARAYPLGYLDYLTWQNRRVLFQPELRAGEIVVSSMTMGPALRYEPSLLDPMKLYRPDSKLGHVAVSFRESRALWRDSASLFAFHETTEGRFRAPATLKWLRELVEESVLAKHQTLRCVARGMSKKQAKVNFFREEHLPLPLSYLVEDALVGNLSDSIDQAERAASALVKALQRTGMFLHVSNPEGKSWAELNTNAQKDIDKWVKHTGVERYYWSCLGLPFQQFIVDLSNDAASAVGAWQEVVRGAARASYERASQYVGNDARSFKALVRGRGYVEHRLREILPQQESIL